MINCVHFTTKSLAAQEKKILGKRCELCKNSSHDLVVEKKGFWTVLAMYTNSKIILKYLKK